MDDSKLFTTYLAAVAHMRYLQRLRAQWPNHVLDAQVLAAEREVDELTKLHLLPPFPAAAADTPEVRS